MPLYAAPPHQPEPVGWLRAIDEAMAVHEAGVADPADDYQKAKGKLNTLLCMAQDAGSYFAAHQAEPVVELGSESWRQADRFCDANCTALDHHADCVIGNPSY